MTPDTLGRLGHLNLLEFGREQARWSDAGRVEEHEGVVLVAAGTTLPFLFNAAGRVDDDADAGSVITAATTSSAGSDAGTRSWSATHPRMRTSAPPARPPA